jgi:exoribonuclease II
MDQLKPDSLLLYKQRPARLVHAGDRLEIEVEGGERVRVRPKDVVLLHPGPLPSLAELKVLPGEIHAAWEILAGEKTSLAELSELIYGRSSPVAAWSAWQHVVEGTYFEGTPEEIQALTAEEAARRKLERDLAGAAKRAWQAFMERTKRGEYQPIDRDFLREVKETAARCCASLGGLNRSRMLMRCCSSSRRGM